MAQYDALLKPLTIKGLTLRNRVISTSHAPAYAEDAMPKERYQRYHEEKAKGGLAMTMFGGSSVVSPECPATFGQLDVSDDRILPYFKEFSERVHRQGAALMCQLSHMGRRTRWDAGDWLVPVAPSRVREPEHRSFPKEMEDWDFRRIIHDFGQAARRCKEGGLDGVELSFASLHLVPAFWSPGTNKRTDQYGGSLDNRLRFSDEILEEVRGQVGADYIVSVRMIADELIEDGLVRQGMPGDRGAAREVGQDRSPERLGRRARRLAQPGDPHGQHGLSRWRPSCISPAPSSPHVDIPIIHAQRVTDIATAARAVEEGHVDLIGMTRAHLADPHIVRKLMEGRPDDIRQCVGANYCIDRIYVGGEALCIQNPATGRERTMPHVIAKAGKKKRVVVVGAGPAGLEAARVSAERGHDVVLFERSGRTGGQVNIAARATWRELLSGIVRWLDLQAKKLKVDLRLNAEATADAVLARESGPRRRRDRRRAEQGRLRGRRATPSPPGTSCRARWRRAKASWSTTTTAATRPSRPPSSWPSAAPRSSWPRPSAPSASRSAPPTIRSISARCTAAT